MATTESARDSRHEDEQPQGLIFRLAARAGLVLFAAVFIMAGSGGMDPALAFMRALLALAVVMACGWVGEKIVQMTRTEAAPAEAEALLLGAAMDARDAEDDALGDTVDD